MKVFALIIDTVSIQRYVFGSNKLKENLGASFLIQEICHAYLQKVITPMFPCNDFDAWRKNPEKYRIKEADIHFEIGYIGGGNALLFFKKREKADLFVKEWTRMLLIETPGIVTAIACHELDDEAISNKFPQINKNLFLKLQENKYKFIPQTIIPRHGITAECSNTGYSMEIWNNKAPEKQQGYISGVAYAKIKSAGSATKKLNEDFKDELQCKYCFTDQLDKLGQSKGEDSHIAIVHIDGNDMGQRFQGIKTLKDIREMSVSVENATKESFKTLLTHIVEQFEKIQNALGFDTLEKKKKYPKVYIDDKEFITIPLRPIIIGGDDITFVCDGKLGIYFAKIFMEAFEQQSVSDGNALSSCAGISIIKTKYPFYRGYQLAEQLCGNAKVIRKAGNFDANGSWLDFHVAYGGFSGTLKEIRESQFKSAQGELLFRPYNIGNANEKSAETLVKNTAMLKNEFPKSKIKEMREVLTLGKECTERFVNEIEARGLKLPIIDGKSYETALIKDDTPYFDMIELMEFYPSFELEDTNDNKESERSKQ